MVQEAIDNMISKDRTKNEENGDNSSSSSSSMTVLIVAHRLSTVRNADIIFVVENGQVVESGSHDELLENDNGPYTNLISRQMKANDKLDRSDSTPSFGGLADKIGDV
jgi:ABC-type multidrug transport system fused ATPase/permease subunit